MPHPDNLFIRTNPSSQCSAPFAANGIRQPKIINEIKLRLKKCQKTYSNQHLAEEDLRILRADIVLSVHDSKEEYTIGRVLDSASSLGISELAQEFNNKVASIEDFINPLQTAEQVAKQSVQNQIKQIN